MTKIKAIINLLSSLKFALTCFVALFIIILVGTFAQINHGIYYVQKVYFHSFFIFITVKNITIPIFPGGALIGTMLIINLSLSTILKIKWTLKKSGLLIIHLGLILLLLGGGLTSCISTESQIYLEEGKSTFYSEDLNLNELIIIDSSNPKFDKLIAIDYKELKQKKEIQHKSIPFKINIHNTFDNSQLNITKINQDTVVTSGIGKSLALKALPIFTKDNLKNNPSCIISFNDNKSATYLFSLDINGTQKVKINTNTYYIQLQPKRYYFPFLITLSKFKDDYYQGTSIAKSYLSEIKITDFKTNQVQNTKVYMNHPFRKELFTFYQASFGEDIPSSVFQVVFNPGWLLPYISSIIITLGLLIHFSIHLLFFLKKKNS
jgi:hypothetical protein